jgi:ribose transport system substrate-binding protein
MKTASPVRRLVAAIAAVTVAGLGLAACSSETVGGGATSSTASTSSTSPSDFASIIPEGDIVAASKEIVAKSLSGTEGFTPPSTGPEAQEPGAHIAYVAADMTNGGINTVAQAVTEAATTIGWTVDVYDGQASAQGRRDAMNQAIAANPAAIILAGSDPSEQAAEIKEATDQGIPVIGWHEGTQAGPGNGLFTNVTTDPLAVSQLAAAFAVADSDGQAGVAIFTDGQYPIAVEKAEAMKAYVEACTTCSVLSYNDSPIAEATQRMPGLISQLLQQHGDHLTYLLAINGNYFGGAQEALRSAGKAPEGPPYAVAAGDGDAAEFQRIRNVDYQSATVAEPMRLQGWQLVDEANRAIAGENPSGFVAMPGLITQDTVPAGDVFDPPSGYQDIYRSVWGK